jgi:hypothetical protein
MMRVALAPEPPDFFDKVRRPGRRAIAQMAGMQPDDKQFPHSKGEKKKAQLTLTRRDADGKEHMVKVTSESEIPPEKLPSLWTRALDDLMSAYQQICAYSCIRIHPVTGSRSADHMVPKSRAWDRAYEWDNYRLACGKMNSRKKDFEDVLDPFDVEDHWFRLDPFNGEVYANQELEEHLRSRVTATIVRLGLQDFAQYRREQVMLYERGDITLFTLETETPFIARELHRLGILPTTALGSTSTAPPVSALSNR